MIGVKYSCRIAAALATLIFFTGFAAAQNEYHDNTPDEARGKPVNQMTANFALLQAAEKGWEDEIEKLLAGGAKVAARNRFGSTPLLLAAGSGHRKAVKMLLAAESDINHRNIGGSTALILAAEGGHARIAKMLIEADAFVDHANNKGVSAMTAAAYNGDDDVIELLLAEGVDPNYIDRTGKSAIVYAAAKGFTDTVRLLLAAGVNADTRYGNDLTVLMWAAGHANDVPVGDGVAVIAMLVEAGATLDLQDNRGRTALMVASSLDHAKSVEALLKAGARADIADNEGKTARDLAGGEGVLAVLAANGQ